MGQPQALARDSPAMTVKDQPHIVELQALRVVTSIIGREDTRPSRKAGEATCQSEGGQQRPQLARNFFAHMAEQRQWWLLPEPGLLPTGTALSP